MYVRMPLHRIQEMDRDELRDQIVTSYLRSQGIIPDELHRRSFRLMVWLMTFWMPYPMLRLLTIRCIRWKEKPHGRESSP
jgi:hypothetical protein